MIAQPPSAASRRRRRFERRSLRSGPSQFAHEIGKQSAIDRRDCRDLEKARQNRHVGNDAEEENRNRRDRDHDRVDDEQDQDENEQLAVTQRRLVFETRQSIQKPMRKTGSVTRRTQTLQRGSEARLSCSAIDEGSGASARSIKRKTIRLACQSVARSEANVTSMRAPSPICPTRSLSSDAARMGAITFEALLPEIECRSWGASDDSVFN